MANFNFSPGQTGLTLYAIWQRSSDQFYVFANGATIEAFSAANWTSYALPLSEIGSTGNYDATFPAVVAGGYVCTIRQQAGGSPVVSPATDIQRGIGGGDWAGTAFVSFPANFGIMVIDEDGVVSGDVVKVNAITVDGSGTQLDPWGPA